jgi:hypothetical protein
MHLNFARWVIPWELSCQKRLSANSTFAKETRSTLRKGRTVTMLLRTIPTLKERWRSIVRGQTGTGTRSRSCLNDHPFNDGNKRVAFISAYVFLGLNGTEITMPETDVVAIMLELASGEINQDPFQSLTAP